MRSTEFHENHQHFLIGNKGNSAGLHDFMFWSSNRCKQHYRNKHSVTQTFLTLNLDTYPNHLWKSREEIDFLNTSEQWIARHHCTKYKNEQCKQPVSTKNSRDDQTT
ncbi:hypothetical protein NE237_005099 [Protea cynaroides]|uniref:Uncharacterized protein n=1 Tax=Protea cynaroides TaxID=273540 RepID=A0A9Q0QU77_9MAGN|nr:hypothetical protein NE237_005099 [Protea cynaroides]